MHNFQFMPIAVKYMYHLNPVLAELAGVICVTDTHLKAIVKLVVVYVFGGIYMWFCVAQASIWPRHKPCDILRFHNKVVAAAVFSFPVILQQIFTRIAKSSSCNVAFLCIDDNMCKAPAALPIHKELDAV